MLRRNNRVMRRGDRSLAELERVYRSEFKAFVRTATAYLGNVDTARDAVQEGVANAIRNRNSFRHEGTVEAWMWKVVLNAIRSHHRDLAHTRMLAGTLRHEAVSTNGHDSAELVRAAVRRLPERQRLVLFLRFYADMDYATIAEVLDISEGTVGASLNAARTTLRGRLTEVLG
jgi:RNA polymerase sigma-70 factor, ECF subfamily